MAKKRVAVSLRKPPSPEAVDAFVRGAAPPPDGAPAPSATSGARRSDVRELKPQDDGVLAETPAPPNAELCDIAQAATIPAPPSVPTIVEATPAPASVTEPRGESATEGRAPGREAAERGAHVGQIVDAAEVVDVVKGVGGRSLRAVTIYLPVPIAERLSMHCLEHDRDASHVVRDALELLLRKQLPGGAPAEPAHAPRDPFGGRHANGADGFWTARSAFGGRFHRWIRIGRTLAAIWRGQAWTV